MADLRGKSDRDCVAAMLAVTDTAFQDELLDTAKSAGKIETDYAIPETFRLNTPARIEEALEPLRGEGWCQAFPFGTAFTEVEQRLLPALAHLRQVSGSKPALAGAVVRSLAETGPDADERAGLERMQLDRPSSLSEHLYARLVLWAMRHHA